MTMGKQNTTEKWIGRLQLFWNVPFCFLHQYWKNEKKITEKVYAYILMWNILFLIMDTHWMSEICKIYMPEIFLFNWKHYLYSNVDTVPPSNITHLWYILLGLQILTKYFLFRGTRKCCKESYLGNTVTAV